LTTLGVGGPARYFLEATTAEEVCAGVNWAKGRGLAWFVLGGGSNLVVADSGFPGLVLKIGIRGICHSGNGAEVVFSAGAGEDWDGFVAHTVGCGCAGLECLSGIPGTVGAAPVQNVGAYGQEVGQTICRVDLLDTDAGAIPPQQAKDGLAGDPMEVFDRSRCGFGYRTSIFNTSARGRYVILRVEFALTAGGAPSVAYADLQKYFGERVPTLQQTREAVREIRRAKGMLLVEDDSECRSAGSFFKNPLLTAGQFGELQARLAARNLSIPSYPALETQHKVSAAWLIEQAGFSKGYTLGRVGISQKHALAIVNRGGATTAEVMALKNAIQDAVREQFSIELEPEPVFLGFEGEGYSSRHG
jgi:UDP-N-acetylmuramate dehydrogenase